MSLYKYTGLVKRVGLVKSIGLVTKGLIKAIGGFFGWYQWLKLGETDDVTNSGGEGPDGLIISGSMLGKDLVLDWTRGDAGLIALAQACGISNPITYAEMKDLVTYPSVISGTENNISRLFLNNVNQDVFTTIPELSAFNWVFRNTINPAPIPKNVHLIFYGNSITEAVTCSPTVKYPDGLTALLNGVDDLSYSMINLGINGYEGAQMAANFNANVLPHVKEGARNILIFFEFINDTISSGGNLPAQDAYDNMVSVNTQAKANNIETLVMTAPRTTSPSINVGIDAANILLNANNSMFNYFFDVNTIDEMQNPVIPTTTCDGIHLNTLGNEKLYEGVFAYMNANVVESIPTDSVAVLNNTGVKTNGINESISIDDNPDIHIGTSDFTICGTVILKDISVFPRIYTKRTSGNWISFLYDPNNKKLIIETTLGSNAFFVDIANDEKFSFAITRNKFYFNGIHVIDLIVPADINTPAPILLSKFGSSYAAIEWIDFKQFNRNITASEAYSLHYQLDIDYTDLVLFPDFNFNNEAVLTDKSSKGSDMTIVSSDLPTMRTVRNDNRPYHLTDGCTVFTNGVNYKIATYDINQAPNISSIGGYTKIEFVAGSGILKGLLNTYLGILYSDWETNEKTFDEIKAIPIIPKEDFQIDNSGDVIKDMVSEPYKFTTHNGEQVYHNGEKVKNIKLF